ncbi:MAG: hypothetical protein ACOC2J_04745, partial [bacterium]
MSQSTYLSFDHGNSRDKQGLEEKENTFSINYLSIILIIMGYFMGQAEIAGFYSLALIYLTIIAERGPVLFFISSIMIAAGLYQSGDIGNLIYLTAALIGFIIYHFIKDKVKEPDVALINTFLYLLLAFIINYNKSLLAIYYFISIGEAILIYIASYIGLSGMKQIINKQSRLTKLSLLTIFILTSGFLIGLYQLNIVPEEGIDILLYTFLISFAHKIGFSYSIIAGMLYGFALVTAGVMPLSNMFVYIILSLFTALFKGKKKYWIIPGVILTLLLYSGLSPSAYDLKNTILGVSIAAIIYIIVPGKYWNYLYSAISIEPSSISQESYREGSGGLK